MATLTNEQIEQKKKLLAEKMNEMKAIYDELVETGAIELSEDKLDQATGGQVEGWRPPKFGANNGYDDFIDLSAQDY